MSTIKFKHVISRSACASVLALSFAAAASGASAGSNLPNATFESGTDGFSARQNETVSRVSTVSYEGDYCLMVSNRKDAWNGAVYSMTTGWTAGETYEFSCAVRQDSGADVTMQLSLQYSSGGETVYDHIVAASVPSGTWTILENKAYQIPASATGCLLYVETATDLCDF